MAGPKSDRIVIQSPTSLTGSAKRIWRITRWNPETENPWVRWLAIMPLRAMLFVAAVALIVMAWVLVVGWYLLFGLLMVPWRLFRRGARREKRERLRHAEMLEAIERSQAPPPPPPV